MSASLHTTRCSRRSSSGPRASVREQGLRPSQEARRKGGAAASGQDRRQADAARQGTGRLYRRARRTGRSSLNTTATDGASSFTVSAAVGGTIAAARAEAGRDVLGIARGGMLEAMKDAPMTLRHPGGDVTVRVPVVGPSGRDRFPAGRPDLPDDEIAGHGRCVAGAACSGRAGAADLLPSERHRERADWRCGTFFSQRGAWRHGDEWPGHLYRAGCRGLPTERRNWGCSISDAFRPVTTRPTRHWARAFDQSGMAGFVHDDVMASKRGKLLLNLGNALEASLGARNGTRRLATKKSGPEARGRAWGRRSGVGRCRHGHCPAEELMQMGEIPGEERFGGSTSQSLVRRHRTRGDRLSQRGNRVAGADAGMEAPLNAFLTDLMAVIAARARRPRRAESRRSGCRVRALAGGVRDRHRGDLRPSRVARRGDMGPPGTC